MKLNTTLYTITDTVNTDKGINYHIHLNPDSVIYKAHFPEYPVTPGVCIIEIAHELFEHYHQQPLAVKVVKNVKFLSVISPLEVQDITYALTSKEDTDNTIKVQATVTAADTTYAKISFVLG